MRSRFFLTPLFLFVGISFCLAQAPIGSWPGTLTVPDGPGEMAATLVIKDDFDGSLSLDLGGQVMELGVVAARMEGQTLSFDLLTDDGGRIPCELNPTDSGTFSGTCALGTDEAAIMIEMGTAHGVEPVSAEESVRAAVESYFMGHATGDGSFFEKAFHRKAKLYFMRDGELKEIRSSEYIAGASGKPAEDEDKRIRRIEMLDITGDAAIVKVVLDYPAAVFTDYLSLLKVGGKWQIVNKTFTIDRKSE